MDPLTVKKGPLPITKSLPVDKNLKLSDENFRNVIEDDLIEIVRNRLTADELVNFLGGRSYADYKTLIIFASRVYKETPKGGEIRGEILPAGWKVLTTAHDKKLLNDFFAVAYWNASKQSIVVSFRGTVPTSVGNLKADYKGILHNEFTGHMCSALTFADKIKAVVKSFEGKPNVHLLVYFTGHSLGGWLAQMATLSFQYFTIVDWYFVRSKETNSLRVHTVVFDSPGGFDMLNKMKRLDLRDANDNEIVLEKLDITSYLSSPNLVNTCRGRVGTVYRIINKNINNTSTLATHSIDAMKQVILYEPENFEIKEVKDWPIEEKGVIKRLLEFVTPGGQELNELNYYYQLATEENDFNPEPDANVGYIKIRYQVSDVSDNECSINILSETELKFLLKYQELRKTINTSALEDLFLPLRNAENDENIVDKTLAVFSKFTMKDNKISSISESDLLQVVNYARNIVRFYPEVLVRVEKGKKCVWFNVRKPVKLFYGRSDEVAQIRTEFMNSKIVVISGRGGVGKSELAIKYANKRRNYYDGNIIKINAENETSIRQSFNKLLKEINNEEVNDQCNESMIKQVYEYFRFSPQKVLFIFDNAEDESLLELLLPPTDVIHYHVLITSQDSCLLQDLDHGRVSSIILEPFSVGAAFNYVKAFLNSNDSQDTAIKRLIQTLGHTPLVLKIAAATIQRSGFSNDIQTYVDLLSQSENEQKSLINRKIKTSYDKCFRKTTEMAMDRILQEPEIGPLAERVMNILSYLSPDAIDKDSILPFLDDTNENDDGRNTFLLNSAIQLLNQHSLVEVEDEERNVVTPSKNGSFGSLKLMLSTHRLVQLVFRAKVKNNGTEESVLKLGLTHLKEHFHFVYLWEHSFAYENLVQRFIIDGSTHTYRFHALIRHSCFSLLAKIFNKIQYKDLLKVVNKKCDTSAEAAPLHYATLFSGIDIRILHLLITKGADLNARDRREETPLHYTAETGAYEQANYLIKQGAKLDSWAWMRATPLHTASKNGNLDIVKLLCKNGANVCAELSTGMTPTELAIMNSHKNVVEYLFYCGANQESDFYAAAKWGDAKIVEFFLEKFPDSINDFYIDKSALHLAAEFNELAVLKILVESGANVNAETNDSMQPIHYAAKSNPDCEVVKYLIEQGAGVSATTKDFKKIPLHLAAAYNTLAVVKSLIDAGSNISAKAKYSWQPIHYAAQSNTDCEVVKYLIEQGADISATTRYLKTPLNVAAASNSLAVVKSLIDAGSNISAIDYFGRQPIHNAARSNSIEVIKYLIDKSATTPETLFHHAAASNTLEVVEYLIHAGANVCDKDSNGSQPIHKAANENSNSEVIKYLIEQGADVSATTNDLETPLHFAAGYNTLALVKCLIEAGANISATDEAGFQPIHMAATHNSDSEVLKYLIEQGTDISAVTFTLETPLHLAAAYNTLAVVKCLIEAGANVSASDKFHNQPLHIAADSNSDSELIKYFIELGANTSATTKNLDTPLHHAAASNTLAVVKSLIDAGSNISAKASDNWQPIHYTAQSNADCEVVKYLIEQGADVSATTIDLKTPLHFAAGYNKLAVVKCLIKAGAIVSATDEDGYQPIHAAATKNSDSEVLKYLIEQGADISAVTTILETPLHLAAASNTLAVVKCLIEAGANVSGSDKFHNQPLHIAARRNSDSELINYLIDQGADTSATTKNLDTPLHLAVAYNTLAAVEYLVEAGADISAENIDGYQPVHNAAKYSFSHSVIEYLIEWGADIYSTTTELETPLHLAAACNSLPVVKSLINAGADLLARDVHDNQPMHNAVRAGADYIFLNYMIEQGADKSATTTFLETPLHLAAEHNNLAAVECLINAGADVLARDAHGYHPIHSAVRFGADYEVVQHLIEHSSNKSAITNDLETPLHFAAGHGTLALVTLLLNAGADISAKDKNDNQPIHYAAHTNTDIEVIKFLIERGADLSVTTKDLATPLHFAASSNTLEVVATLIDAGANACAKDKQGYQPIHKAAANNSDYQVMVYLTEHGADMSSTTKSGKNCLDLAAKHNDLKIVEFLDSVGLKIKRNTLKSLKWKTDVFEYLNQKRTKLHKST